MQSGRQARSTPNQPYVIPAFFGGGFVSNLGSLVFVISFTLFAMEKGWSLPVTGAVLAAARFTQIFANLAAGDIGDRADPRKILLWTEVVGGLSDVSDHRRIARNQKPAA